MKVKEKSEKADLKFNTEKKKKKQPKLNIQKIEIMASGPITSC